MGRNMLNPVIYIPFLVWSVAFLHELGHYWYLIERMGFKDVKIKFKYGFPKAVVWKEEREITPNEEINIHFSGIIVGVIPFFVFMDLLHDMIIIPLFITYVISCRNDFKIMFNGGKKDGELQSKNKKERV